ncbi:MAG: protein-ADP-ribose hydrolase [Erysipelotrichaceae bacterium]|nr:protein-ADP-ribose hydrolase [Erysipelotrichaceae bacterium]
MQSKRIKYLIDYLIKEDERYKNNSFSQSEDEEKNLLRALLNIREPKTITEEFLKIQDEYLQEEISKKGIVSLSDLTQVEENIYFYKGDITLLKVDAIVNAANSKMLGCFIPNHKCIDNAIHTFSGVQLRLKCNSIMKNQKQDEEVGNAKITPAYNLPSKYIIHTVGPVVTSALTTSHKQKLKECYMSCLNKAIENNITSIAFCCISTGEFHFPNEQAAEIAINTVKEFLNKTDSRIKVIFNVFTDKDERIYKEKLWIK